MTRIAVFAKQIEPEFVGVFERADGHAYVADEVAWQAFVVQQLFERSPCSFWELKSIKKILEPRISYRQWEKENIWFSSLFERFLVRKSIIILVVAEAFDDELLVQIDCFELTSKTYSKRGFKLNKAGQLLLR